MAKIKPRVKVPKKAAVGDIITLKALISHPMHTGLAKNKKTGEKIPRKIINRMTISFEGDEFCSTDFTPAISANPFLAIPFKVTKTGEFKFVWVEDGGAEFSTTKKMTAA